MKNQCETLLEQYEPVIEKWYFEKQEEVPLIRYLCKERALKDSNSECLHEVVQKAGDNKSNEKEEL